MSQLLAVDVGLRTGLALFGPDGRLRWYRSQRFPNRSVLKRGVQGMLRDQPAITRLVLEGGGPLAEIWRREAARLGIGVHVVAAENWRRDFLYARERRCGRDAKRFATELARRVITWSGSPRPTSLRDDAAEAILTGLREVLELGWLAEMPAEIRHPF